MVSPRIPAGTLPDLWLKKMEQVLTEKGEFYRETLESLARVAVLEIFRSCPTTKQTGRTSVYHDLIRKINDEFAFIRFSDAAKYCGYSPAHFSKMFKVLSGMTFSDCLNVLKVEQAIRMLRCQPQATVTTVSAACGFSTIRNFNRVFKELTGYTPRSLPDDYLLDTDLRISGSIGFDPTHIGSELVAGELLQTKFVGK